MLPDHRPSVGLQCVEDTNSESFHTQRRDLLRLGEFTTNDMVLHVDRLPSPLSTAAYSEPL